jgi:sugar/nucleoside kinase (ribokinase family)
MSSIQVAGHVCVDLTPTLGSAGVAAPGELAEVGPMTISIGGAVGNCGRVLSGLGVDVSLSASVGDDELGAICLRLLQERHGEAVDLTVVPGLATSYSVVVEPPGIDRSFWHHTGANDVFDGECAVTARQLLHFGYPSLAPAMCAADGEPIVRLFERARQQGVATSLDLAFLAANSPLQALDWSRLFRAVLPSCDVFCPSWDDVVSSLGLPADASRDTVAGWAEKFLDWGAGIVLITLGEEGAYLRVSGAERLGTLAACGIQPEAWAGTALWIAPDTLQDIVTTNGAGDTYKAAFLARLVWGAGPRECLHFAGEIVARHLCGRSLLG